MSKPYLQKCSRCNQEISVSRRLGNFVCTYCKNYPKEFNDIRNKVLAEIGYCEICQDNKNLHVHHKNKDKQDSHRNNLMVLCSQCHRSFHKHNLKLPLSVKWGKVGKRLIYKEQQLSPLPMIKIDERYGKVFYQKINNQYKYLITKG